MPRKDREGLALAEQVRFTSRKLARAPTYTLLAVGLLGLGLGVVAATYTVLSQVVLRPLPVTDQDRLVVAWTDHRVRGFDHYPVTPPLFEAAERGEIPAFVGVAAVGSYGTGQLAVVGVEGPAAVASARVLGDFFGVLGAEPWLGRVLRGSDDLPGAPARVAVISHDFWMRSYGGSPDVLGRSLRTRVGTYTIVGVMPPDFDYPTGAEVWMPTRPEYPGWESERPRLELDLVARLAPGATMDVAREQLGTLTRSTPELSDLYEGTVPVLRPFAEHVLGDLRPTLLLLFLGGLLVLVVASLDLANIVLVRAVGERRQSAVRQALGMDRRWVVREGVIEAAVLALLATGVGVLIGGVAVRLLLPFAPADVTRLDRVQNLDASTIALVPLGALLAVAAAVVLPRWRVAQAEAGPSFLRSAATTSSRGGKALREAVVAAQVGIAVWVLVTGALLVRTVANLQGLDAGFDPHGLSLVALDHADGGVLAEPGENRLLAAAVARIESSNAVLGATPVQMAPLPGNGAWQMILYKEGQSAEQAQDENVYLFMEFVEPDFASILDVPVLRGRIFDESDGEDAPGVLVVNGVAAKLYWPGQEAVGQTVTIGLPGHEAEPFRVIGVVGDTRYGALTELKPTVYFPSRQVSVFGARYILLRSTGSHAPLFELVREALEAEAPRYRAISISSVSERLDEPLVRPRLAALLLTLLAFTALLMAVAGTYSVMAFSVRTRRRELGVRLACGGAPVHVGGLIVRRGLAIAMLGSLLGAGAATTSAGLFRSLLFGVAPVDAYSLLAGVGLALACTSLACLSPALRAATTDPVTVLKAE